MNSRTIIKNDTASFHTLGEPHSLHATKTAPKLLEHNGIRAEEIIGIEKFINEMKPAMAIAAEKKVCTEAVLNEQKLQKDLRIYNPERLANVSRSYSRHATNRADCRASYAMKLD